MKDDKISKETIDALMDVIKNLKDEVKTTKYGLDWLMVTIKHLEKRVDVLEQNAMTNNAKESNVVLRPGREL